MKVVHTNGKNSDFIILCKLLDASLDEIVGGEIQREKYNQYNQLDHINDAVIIYINEQPVASGSFKHYHEGIAEIKRIFVKKEFRGRGLSKIIMEHLEHRAVLAGYKTFYLETGRPLVASMNLYKSIGFKIIDNYGPYKEMPESICMAKKLV